MGGEGVMGKCKECGGTGVVQIQWADGQRISADWPCPRCEGKRRE